MKTNRLRERRNAKERKSYYSGLGFQGLGFQSSGLGLRVSGLGRRVRIREGIDKIMEKYCIKGAYSRDLSALYGLQSVN